MNAIREIKRYMKRRMRERIKMLLCVQMLNEQRRKALASMELCQLHAREGHVESAIWAAKKQRSKN